MPLKDKLFVVLFRPISFLPFHPDMISDIRVPISDIRVPISNIWVPISDVWVLISNVRYLYPMSESDIQYMALDKGWARAMAMAMARARARVRAGISDVGNIYRKSI